MEETENPSCDCCGEKQIKRWICESCSFNQKLQQSPNSEIRDVIGNFEWSSNKKLTPPTYYATKSYNDKQVSPTSFRDFMFSRREQDQSNKKRSLLTNRDKTNQTHYMFCKHHDQPLSFYNKQSKQILCSICLFQKGALSKSSKMKESVLLPLKASIDLVRIELKQLMTNLSQSSNNLQQSIKTCRRSSQSIRYHQNKLLSQIQQISQIMIEQIRLKQKQSKTWLKVQLGNILQQFQSKQSKFRELSSDTRQLKYLASKSRELKSDELAYLFQSVKQMKQQLKHNIIKIQPFNTSDYHLKQFNRRKFKEQIDSYLSCQELEPIIKSKKKSTVIKVNKDPLLKHRDKSYSSLSRR